MTKLGLRNLWFQFHKWIGLALAILILPLCISGAALVWHDALDKALNPGRYAVTAAEPKLTPPAYVDSALAALTDGERIASMRFEHGEPVLITATQPRKPSAREGGRPVRIMVWLDPANAHVLDKARSDAGLVRTLHNIHGNMMVPGVGRTIVGALGFAMLVSSISGLWLWWPTVGSALRGVRWRRHRNFDTNLHHMMGFWIALPLFVLSLTGAWISFPALFGNGPVDVAGRMAKMRAMPLAKSVQSIDEAIARARSLEAGQLKSMEWPTDQRATWTLGFKTKDGPVTIAVDDAKGTSERSKSTGPQPDATGRLMRRIHDGTGMGIAWQIVIFLGGLLPAGLALTGVIMWWRARLWRNDLASRQNQKVVATP